MALQNYDNLNGMHMDVLREVCNIGSGNAASSLSQMFSIQVDIEIPDVCIVDVNQAVEKFGGAEAIMAGLMLPISVDLNGIIMFLFDHEFAGILLQKLMGVEISGFDDIDEMGFSAINEAANIAAASFVNAIAAMTSMKVDIAPPVSTVDMVGAIMNVPAAYFANISEKIMLMENKFICGGEKLEAHILIIPDIESLERLMTKLGIEV